MIKRIYGLLLLILLFPAFGYSQEKSSILNFSGVVHNEKDEPLPFVKITLKNGKQKDVTNLWGMFSVVVSNTDTIFITAEGYEKLRLVIRDTLRRHQICVDIKMNPDTTAEPIAVFPYKTYEEFKDAVLNLELKEDADIERARKNMALIRTQILLDNSPNPSVNFKAMMQDQYDRMYVNGQFMSNPLLNIFNWSRLIKEIQKGSFKNSRDLRNLEVQEYK